MRKNLYSLLRLFFILLVLSVTSIPFVQTSFSQTDTVDIIKEIHESERQVRDHIDNKFTQHETKYDAKFDDLNDKFTNLKSGVDVNRSKIEGLEDRLNSFDTRINIILAAVLAGLFTYFGRLLWEWRQKYNSTQASINQTEEVADATPTFRHPTSPQIEYPQGTAHEG